MKKNLFVLFSLALLVSLVGCKSANSSAGGNMSYYPATIGPIDSYRPLYEVDETKRVSGSAKVNVLFGIFAWGDGSGIADNASIFGNGGVFGFVGDFFPNAKNMAAKAAFYNACKQANCDSVVSAHYDIKSTDYFVFKRSEVTVKGYPAVQKGVETVKIKPYYVDAEGKIVWVDKFFTPVEIADFSRPKASVSSFSFFSGLF